MSKGRHELFLCSEDATSVYNIFLVKELFGKVSVITASRDTAIKEAVYTKITDICGSKCETFVSD